MPEISALSATVHGRVQGVYFRAFVRQHARNLALTGYVRNLPGGTAVEVRAEGQKTKLEELVGLLQTGPSGAKVDRVDWNWAVAGNTFDEFTVQY